MSKSGRVLVCVFLATVCSSLGYGVTPDRIAGVVSGQSVTLRGNVHHNAVPQFDQGLVDPTFRLTYMTLLTTPSASQIKALQQLLAQQQDPKSANYRKWLTPEQWADRFGLSAGDVKQLTNWLKSSGFTVESVARGRNWIVFGGTAAQAQNVFGTEIHRYSVNGEAHFANASAPRIPAGLAGIVSGINGLNDFRPKPHNAKNARAVLHPGSDYYDNILEPPAPPDFIAPGDIATMYDINALYTLGIDGTGQKLAIAGQTDVYLADLNDFRNAFHITAISGCTTNSSGAITSCMAGGNFQYILNGADPGVSTNDLTEADLDLEWSNAVARNAQIVYINSGTANGVWDSWYYAIDHSVAPVVSLSYGNCEFNDNNVIDPTTGLPGADEVELMKANSLGITFMNSTGDSGAAGCDGPQNAATSNLAVGGLAVGYPASSPEVTGVGGTAVSYPAGFASTYWLTTNAADGGSAQNPPIPETAWNDDEELGLAYGGSALSWQESYAIVSTGGGASNCATQTTDFSSCAAGFPKPSWQTVTVTGQGNVRYSPDVSLLGSPNFPGYIFCTATDAWIGGTSTASTCANGIPAALALTDSGGNPAPSLVGGTSASAPAFAGIVVLLNQYLGTSGLGNINPTLYTLAKTPANGAFHEVTTGDNNVYCEIGTPVAPWPVALQCPSGGIFGFSASVTDATTGYNLVTGLGSVDANNLALAWDATRATTTTALQSSLANTYQSQNVTLTANVTPSSATGSVTFMNMNGTASLGTVALSGGSAQITTASLPVGANKITASFAGSATLKKSTSTVATVTVVQAFTLSADAATYPVTQGQKATITITVNTNGSGFNGALTFTCSDAAPESTCTGPASSTTQTSVSFSVSTTAPTASLRRPGDESKRIFYALLLPGLFGLVLTVGARKRSMRGMRLLGLIMVMGLSTMWLGSCGGSSGSTKDQGTTPGMYNISISANSGSGSSSGATGSITVQLNVQ